MRDYTVHLVCANQRSIIENQSFPNFLLSKQKFATFFTVLFAYYFSVFRSKVFVENKFEFFLTMSKIIPYY